MENKNEIAQKFAGLMKELEKTKELENLIADNKIEFKINEDTFRVRKATFVEQEEVESHRRKKYVEFVKDPSMLFRKQWVETYLAKGIDINKMEAMIQTKQAEIEGYMLKLATTDDPSYVKKFEEEIIKLRTEQAQINMEKTDLLNYSIEDQLALTVSSYNTYVTLEKKTSTGDWEKVYKTFEDFSNSKDQELISKAFYYATYLTFKV